MRRFSHLWSQVVTFENLLLAYNKARKGKRSRDEVAYFMMNYEYELLDLQKELVTGQYKPRAYRQFIIYERKPRTISAASFRDRVVHHAIMNIVEPLLDRSFIFDSYACRKNKGVHAAVDRYQRWSEKYYYALKLDIASYFPSIDHQILKQQLQHKIKDKKVLWLLNRILAFAPQTGSKRVVYFSGDDLLTPLERRIGLPIGNLTSQFFANLYLNELDHFIKEKLKVSAYLRYVDDMVLLSNNKLELHDWHKKIAKRLEKVRLKIHPRKANVFTVRSGVDVLGYNVFPDYRLLRNDNGHRFSRKLRKFSKCYAKGTMDWEDFNPSVQSWIGHASQADTEGLRKAIFNKVAFRRE